MKWFQAILEKKIEKNSILMSKIKPNLNIWFIKTYEKINSKGILDFWVFLDAWNDAKMNDLNLDIQSQ